MHLLHSGYLADLELKRRFSSQLNAVRIFTKESNFHSLRFGTDRTNQPQEIFMHRFGPADESGKNIGEIRRGLSQAQGQAFVLAQQDSTIVAGKSLVWKCTGSCEPMQIRIGIRLVIFGEIENR